MGKSYKERPDKFKGRYNSKKKGNQKKSWKDEKPEEDFNPSVESWDR